MVTRIEELNKRIDKIEIQKNQELLTLVEILSNATFFGQLKKTSCDYSRDGQCGYFFLNEETKNKIPIATKCRIEGCKETSPHNHIELSNITCSLCTRANR